MNRNQVNFVCQASDGYFRLKKGWAAILVIAGLVSLIPAAELSAAELKGTLFGQSAGGDRYPIPYSALKFCSESGACADTFTGVDGSYRIEVRPNAEYQIIAPSRDGGTVSDGIFVPGGMERLDILAD